MQHSWPCAPPQPASAHQCSAPPCACSCSSPFPFSFVQIVFQNERIQGFKSRGRNKTHLRLPCCSSGEHLQRRKVSLSWTPALSMARLNYASLRFFFPIFAPLDAWPRAAMMADPIGLPRPVHASHPTLAVNPPLLPFVISRNALRDPAA